MDQKTLDNLQEISTGELMMEFAKYYHQNFLNWETPTLGGHTFWNTLYEVEGWKVQKCKTAEKLLPHYRILDPENKRKGWSLTEDQFQDDIQNFIDELHIRRQIQDHRYGIVFSGGGAKGAYQVGVWKYLNELGIDKEITGVSGASVGALNSLLFAQGDYQAAESVWLNIQQEDLTKVDLSTILTTWLEVLKGIQAPLPTIASIIANLRKSRKDHAECLGFFSSQKRLREIISTYVQPDKVLQTPKLVYSSLTQIPSFQPYYVCWKLLDNFNDIRDLVLTSASMPLMYPARFFHKRLCVDGGVGDNVPFSKLALDFDSVIVIHLSPSWDTFERKQWAKSFGELQETTARIYHVYPSVGQNMSGGTQVMQIEPDLTRWRMDLGYQDAKRQLKKLIADL